LRVNWNYIKGLLLLILVGFLYAFSSHKNGLRTVRDISINFTSESNVFITRESVNKLLIQNEVDLKKVPKEILDLNGLETALKSNPMIKTAEVYLTVNGGIRADVEQRKPIARVATNASFYIDEEGLFMPLSTNRSARVPLVTGKIYKNDLSNVHHIAKKIQDDEFLKMHIVGIVQSEDKSITLKTRALDFEIFIGQLDHLEKKINNLKAFYQKAKKDKTLASYKKVNLQFESQVVCTKK
jgi:cell division protein FtsQ